MGIYDTNAGRKFGGNCITIKLNCMVVGLSRARFNDDIQGWKIIS